MPKYQIEFKEGTSSHFAYFEAEKDIEVAAAQRANEDVEKQIEMRRGFGRVIKPRTIMVREYDTAKRGVKRGGHKFKLRLLFLQKTFLSGRKEREEWYAPVTD